MDYDSYTFVCLVEKWTWKLKSFRFLKKIVSHGKKSRQYPMEIITDTNSSDDLELLGNTPAYFESLLHRLEQAARSISLYLNSEKTDFMCFNQDGAISSLNDKPLKLVDQFIYINRMVSSTEKKCQHLHR